MSTACHVTRRLKYDAVAQDLTIELAGIAPTDRVELTLRPIDLAWLLEDRRAARCRQMLGIFRLESESKRWIDQHLDEILADVDRLREAGVTVKDSHLAVLRSVIEGKGGLKHCGRCYLLARSDWGLRPGWTCV